MNLDSTAIRSVTFYQATPVQTCDRCSAGIKNVFLVAYRDGETQRYGSECINRILEAQPTLRKLFHKNAKLLALYKDYLAILSGPIESMPRGSEYYGSGLYMVADSNGKDIAFRRYFFHPVFDAEKNASGAHYVQNLTLEQYAAKRAAEIAPDLPKLEAEIARLEAFLAKIMRSVKTA